MDKGQKQMTTTARVVVPSDIWSQAKAAAALEGKTVQKWIAELIEHQVSQAPGLSQMTRP